MSQSRRLFDWWIWNAYGRTHTHTLTYRFYRNDEFDTIQWILVRGFFFLSSTSTLSPNQVNWSECIWELFFFFLVLVVVSSLFFRYVNSPSVFLHFSLEIEHCSIDSFRPGLKFAFYRVSKIKIESFWFFLESFHWIHQPVWLQFYMIFDFL